MTKADPPERTAADAMVETLALHGFGTIYCLPGVQNDWFFNALHDNGTIDVIHTRHEQGAGYMALGAAMATGDKSAFCVVPGPGLLNASAALATAYSCNAPVLCLAGQIPSNAIGKGFGALHETPDQSGVLARLTKQSKRAKSPQAAAPLLAELIAEMGSGRPRPVALEVSPDQFAARGTFADVKPETLVHPRPDHDTVTAMAKALSKARRPMILVGSGAQNVSAEVGRLALRIQAPVLSYRMGRGVLDDRSPYALTIPGGLRLWQDCDVVLGIGTRMQMALQQWGRDKGLQVLRIDVDGEESRRFGAPDLSIEARAEDTLPLLLDALEVIGDRPADRKDELVALKARVASELNAKLGPQMSFLAAIRSALPDEAILVEDLTQPGYVSRFGYPVHRPRTFLSSGYQGNLGWSYAAALGAQHAKPDVPVVAICGDGGFMFNVQELATAVRHKIPAIVIVFNDNAFGNVRRMQQELYGGRTIASDLANPDFVALAKSFGVAGRWADTHQALREQLVEAVKEGVPTLIEVPCGPMPDPFPYILASRAKGVSSR